MGDGEMLKKLTRGFVALLGGALSYIGWLAIFLLTTGWESALWDLLVWLLAPVVTGAGFAAGLALGERLTGRARTPFWKLWLWPLLGCAAGAAVVYPFGPMLIVFGMLAAGAGSVLLRELVAISELGSADRGRPESS
jgi:hypothetical protein